VKDLSNPSAAIPKLRELSVVCEIELTPESSEEPRNLRYDDRSIHEATDRSESTHESLIIRAIDIEDISRAVY
jgi:hypothetical protein